MTQLYYPAVVSSSVIFSKMVCLPSRPGIGSSCRLPFALKYTGSTSILGFPFLSLQADNHPFPNSIFLRTRQNKKSKNLLLPFVCQSFFYVDTTRIKIFI